MNNLIEMLRHVTAESQNVDFQELSRQLTHIRAKQPTFYNFEVTDRVAKVPRQLPSRWADEPGARSQHWNIRKGFSFDCLTCADLVLYLATTLELQTTAGDMK